MQDWSNENNWLCSPVSLIVQTVRKLHRCHGFGTFIIPEWPSGLFWPFLHASALAFKPYVKGVFILPKFPDLLIKGPGQKAIYRGKTSVFSGCPAFNMLALFEFFEYSRPYVVGPVFTLVSLLGHVLLAARPCIFILESFAMCCWPCSLFYHNGHMLLAASYIIIHFS